MPKTKLQPLDEKEKAEFDNINYDAIQSCKDVKKLMRLEAYMRAEGYAPTADTAAARLRELGQRAANLEAQLDPEASRRLAEEKSRASADIAAWTAKQRQTDAALEAASREGPGGPCSQVDAAFPPVRAPVRMVAAAEPPKTPTASQQPVKPKSDSAVGTQVRSGRDYYDRWEKKVEEALAEADREDTSAASIAGKAAAAASTAGLKRSPELTARLLELNRGASAAERLLLSASEKSKGNDHFRAKEYGEAVEHYTLALGLRGAAGDPALFGNRAAAYIKLQIWDAAEADASAALEADPAMLKAYIRRAAARLELGRLAEAVADCDAALALAPDSKEAAGLRERGAKLLQESGMKRMSIVEVEEEEEEDGEEGVLGQGGAAAAKPQQRPPPSSQQAVPARKKLVVVETDSEDSDEEAASAKAASSGEGPTASAAPKPTEQQEQKPVATSATEATSNSGSKAAAPSTVAPAAAAPPPVALGSPVAAPAPQPWPSPAPMPSSPPAAAQAAAPAVQAATPAPTPAVPQSPPVAVPTAPLPPPPPTVDLPPPPSPPAPTPPSQFDAAVDSIKQEGNREFKSGNKVRAAQLYGEALALAPDLATLYINRSMARLDSGLNVEALKDAVQAVALAPDSYKALNKRARAKERLRLWEGARDDMQRCLDLMPPTDRSRKDVEGELARAEAGLAATLRRAADRAATAAAREPKVTRYASARVTIEEHHEEEGEEDKVLVPPEDVDVWELTAQQRIPQLRQRAAELRAEWLGQRDAEARELYQQALLSWEAAKERTEAAAAVAAAAAAEEAAAKEAAAAAAATTAAAAADTAAAAAPLPPLPPPVASAADGGSVEAIKDKGNTHLKAGCYTKAEECYAQCLRLEPGNMAVRLNLLMLLNDTGRFAEAEAAADKALELLTALKASMSHEQYSNMLSKVRHRRGTARRALGRLLEAQEDLQAAWSLLRQSPKLDQELEALGRLIAQQGGEAAAEPAVAEVAAEARAPAAEAVRPGKAVANAAAPVQAGGNALVQPAAAPSRASELARPPQPSAAAAAAATNSTDTTTRGDGSGAAAVAPPPVRRRMEVQVESDDSDSDEEAFAPSLPLPPASNKAATAVPQPAPSPALAAQQQQQQTPAASVPSPSTSPPSKQAAASAVAANSKTGAPATPAPAATPATPAAATSAPAAKAAAAAAAAPTPAAKSAFAAAASSGPVGDPGDTAEAQRLRNEGNRLYDVGNYVRAVEYYSRSIAACAHNPASYCNRAYLYLHLQRPADALVDAEAAIEQSGGRYAKAQLRRALALRALGRVDDAIAEMQRLLDAAPGDEALLEEMGRLKIMKAAGTGGQAAAKPSSYGVAPAAAVRPVQAPPVRHKVVVEEVSSDSEEEAEEQEQYGGDGSGPAPVAPAAAEVSSNGAAASSSSPTTAQAAAEAAPAAASSSSDSTADTGNTAAAKANGAVSPAAAAAAAGGRAMSLHEAAAAKAAAALAVAAKAPKKPKQPKNAHELEQALKSLAAHPAVLYDYIRSLDPASYAVVIKANLSVKMLQAFVEAARTALRLPSAADGGDAACTTSAAPPQPDDVDLALRSLESLTLVPRFDMTYGLAGKAMKEDVRVVFGALTAAGRDVSLLKKSYKL